jgi:hypothetical protein
MVIVFDGVPQSIAEGSGLNLADRVTILDRLAWMSLRGDAVGFSVMLLDLASHQHPTAFGVADTAASVTRPSLGTRFIGCSGPAMNAYS